MAAARITMLIFLLSSCATMREVGDKMAFWNDDEKRHEVAEGSKVAPPVEEKDGSHVVGITSKEMELKQAKMWARLDEIENELRVHKAHIKVLEKGIKLGIVPDELLSDNYGFEEKKRNDEPQIQKQNITEIASEPAVAPKQAQEKSPGTQEDFKRSMSEAESFFRAGHYGKAIATYEKIGRDFAEYDVQNSHRYWIALCWYRLKELQVAKDEFASFLDDAKASPWRSRAEFYLAKIQSESGLMQSALTALRDIIKKYPHDETVEMAKMEIEKIEQRL